MQKDLQLVVNVTDVDILGIGNDKIDDFVIDLDPENTALTTPTSYTGVCGTGATLELRIKISEEGTDGGSPTSSSPSLSAAVLKFMTLSILSALTISK